MTKFSDDRRIPTTGSYLRVESSAEGRIRFEDALRQISAGGMVIVTDDVGREDEGDLIAAASLITEQSVAFMVRHTTGILCVAITGEDADRLRLPPMIASNEDPNGTSYTVSCDARAAGTGVSASDRLMTFRLLADPESSADDLRRPGHVFPLRAHPEGLLGRRGHTEAAVDLVSRAGLLQAGVLGELVNDDGSMMRGDALMRFGADHGIPVVSIENLVACLHPVTNEAA